MGSGALGSRSGNLGRLPGILERGIEFLLEGQSGDGLWHDFLTLAGEGSDWPTGVIATELALAGAEREPLERAAGALLADQQPDGGWGYRSGVPTDADSTACVLLFLAAMGHRCSRVARAGTCLAGHQDKGSGGVSTYRSARPIRRFMGLGTEIDLGGWCSSHLEVTATAGQALARVSASEEVEAAWRYVASRQRTDGSWASYWWTTPHYPTLQAVGLAIEMDDEAAVARAADWTESEQDEDGGWSAPAGATTSTHGSAPRDTVSAGDAATSAFATALSLSVLLRAGRRGPAVDRGVERLLALQEADGGWPSHPIMRIPPPDVAEPEDHRAWRANALGTGVMVGDQHRMFTTAMCVGALGPALRANA
jgi:squalene cyclase